MVQAKTTIWIDEADNPIFTQEDNSLLIVVPGMEHGYDVYIGPELLPHLRQALNRVEAHNATND
jgi:hypothetical protein